MNLKEMELDPRWLKAARISQGFTQDDIADLLGMSGSAYQKREQGVTEFKVKEAIIISNFLDEPLEKIFSYKLENSSSSNKAS